MRTSSSKTVRYLPADPYHVANEVLKRIPRNILRHTKSARQKRARRRPHPTPRSARPKRIPRRILGHIKSARQKRARRRPHPPPRGPKPRTPRHPTSARPTRTKLDTREKTPANPTTSLDRIVSGPGGTQLVWRY